MFCCTKCGACCRNLKKSIIYRELDRGDSVCKYLKENLCSIYENRPLLCRIDDCYEAFFRGIMSKELYYQMNYEMCEELRNLE